jgi:hypothetical protein
MKFCVILDRKPVIKLQVPYTVVNFANWGNSNFSARTLLQGVCYVHNMSTCLQPEKTAIPQLTTFILVHTELIKMHLLSSLCFYVHMYQLNF